jgi:hypothetical protein
MTSTSRTSYSKRIAATCAIVGLATAFGIGGANSVLVRTLNAAVPGPGGDTPLFNSAAVERALHVGTRLHNRFSMVPA